MASALAADAGLPKQWQGGHMGKTFHPAGNTFHTPSPFGAPGGKAFLHHKTKQNKTKPNERLQ